MQKNLYQHFYSVLYILSIMIYFLNFLIQNQIIFSFTDSYGIISKMNILFWVGYLILIFLIYFQFKYFEEINENLVYLTLLLLVTYLISTPFFYEHLARFEDTWGHSYLVQEIFKTGEVKQNISPYEDFPGSLLFYGVLFQGFPYYLMKFFPPILYFVGIAVVYMLFKLLFNPKISFLSAVFYMFFNWTVEDNHISPQFLMLFIFFIFLYITIKLFKKWKIKEGLILITLFSFVIVFSHTGTPIFLILILVSTYLLCKKHRKILLPIIIILTTIFLLYSLYTVTLNGYVDQIKNFFTLLYSSNIFSRVSERFVSNTLSREIFIDCRLAITAFSILAGLAGIILLYTRKYTLEAKFFFAWSFCMLAFSFFVGIILKGEFYERFVLISSLPLAGLTVYALNGLKSSAIFLIILLLISPLYFVAKYGNEYFESISSEKLQTDCFHDNFNSNCEDEQKIVDTGLYYDIADLGKKLTVTREETLISMMYLGKSKGEIEDMIRSTEYGQMLDRIYSTYSSTVFR